MSENEKEKNDLGGKPLVVCVACESIVRAQNAEAHWVSIGGKPERVWFCKKCVRLGRGDQVQKYVMRKEKTRVGREESSG